MFVMGIDGGGTSTRVELRNADNTLQQRRFYGAFNLNSIGEEAFSRLLHQIFGDDLSQCAGICIGAAGISNPQVTERIEQALAQAHYTGPRKLCGDQEIALRGAIDGPGLIVIAGTGSICFGRNQAGETARSGGYGHLIDDGGSGYALGRDALSACVRAMDGRGSGTVLAEQILKALEIETPEELISFVYHPDTRKSDIAALASVVLDLADQEDSTAREILRRGTGELVCMVQAVQDRLQLFNCPIALLGGLLTSQNPYSKNVKRFLSVLGTVQSPAHDALWGAAQLAWELSRNR